MAKARGAGLLIVWADIDPENEAEYHRRYDEEHFAHLLAVPDCLGARRYVAIDGQPKYLTLYEFDNPHVSESAPGRRRTAATRGAIGCGASCATMPARPASTAASTRSELLRDVVRRPRFMRT